MPAFLERIKARKFNSVASTALDIGVNGEAQARVTVDAGGKLTWGGGSTTGDVTLYRYAANTLKTDDTLIVADLYVGENQVTTYSLSSETTIDGGIENTRIVNATISMNTITDTVDGGSA
jgi:hypothetical protein